MTCNDWGGGLTLFLSAHPLILAKCSQNRQTKIDVCSFKMVCKSHRLWLGMFLNTFFYFEYLGNPSLGLYWLKGRVIAIILKILWALLWTLMSVHPLFLAKCSQNRQTKIKLDPPHLNGLKSLNDFINSCTSTFLLGYNQCTQTHNLFGLKLRRRNVPHVLN